MVMDVSNAVVMVADSVVGADGSLARSTAIMPPSMGVKTSRRTRVSLDTATSAGGEAVHTRASSSPLLPSKPQDPPDRQRAAVAVGVNEGV